MIINFEHWSVCGWVESYPCDYVLRQMLQLRELFDSSINCFDAKNDLNSSSVASILCVIWFSNSGFNTECDLTLCRSLWYCAWFELSISCLGTMRYLTPLVGHCTWFDYVQGRPLIDDTLTMMMRLWIACYSSWLCGYQGVRPWPLLTRN